MTFTRAGPGEDVEIFDGAVTLSFYVKEGD